MRAQYLIGPAILTAIAMSGTVAARTIVVDSGNFGNFDSSLPNNGGVTFSTTGQTFPIDGLLMSFSPGTSMATGAMFSPDGNSITDYCVSSSTCSTAITTGTGAMFNWGPQPGSQQAGPTGITEQVIVYQLADNQSLPVVGSPGQNFTTAGAFEVDFNYAATSCAGETGSLSVGGQKYTSAANPCVSVDNAFFFNDSGGKLMLEGTPSGWSPAGVVSAPEIDPNSAVAGFSLMFGGLAVLLGRRRLPLLAKSAA
jgi:hypothetical protein